MVAGSGLWPGSMGIGYPWYSGTILSARIASIGVPFTSSIERFQSPGIPGALLCTNASARTGVPLRLGTGSRIVTLVIVVVYERLME
ncbi:MAG: hypothetical protein A4E41_01932 [Methanoregulaceae archaeon PtaU1.Bin066]|nr:MAG: hypothetical protein A4E41_01932 [Methanoregulaceae archaeon PtaU1.Bin066]